VLSEGFSPHDLAGSACSASPRASDRLTQRRGGAEMGK